jgi:hypothetical protein
VRHLHHPQANFVGGPQLIAVGVLPDRLVKMLKERWQNMMEITILILRPESSIRMLWGRTSETRVLTRERSPMTILFSPLEALRNLACLHRFHPPPPLGEFHLHHQANRREMLVLP